MSRYLSVQLKWKMEHQSYASSEKMDDLYVLSLGFGKYFNKIFLFSCLILPNDFRCKSAASSHTI